MTRRSHPPLIVLLLKLLPVMVYPKPIIVVPAAVRNLTNCFPVHCRCFRPFVPSSVVMAVVVVVRVGAAAPAK